MKFPNKPEFYFSFAFRHELPSRLTIKSFSSRETLAFSESDPVGTLQRTKRWSICPTSKVTKISTQPRQVGARIVQEFRAIPWSSLTISYIMESVENAGWKPDNSNDRWIDITREKYKFVNNFLLMSWANYVSSAWL